MTFLTCLQYQKVSMSVKHIRTLLLEKINGDITVTGPSDQHVTDSSQHMIRYTQLSTLLETPAHLCSHPISSTMHTIKKSQTPEWIKSLISVVLGVTLDYWNISESADLLHGFIYRVYTEWWEKQRTSCVWRIFILNTSLMVWANRKSAGQEQEQTYPS